MSDSKIILKNTAIYSIGNLGSKILSFLLVPLYSYYLTKTEMGYYDILITTLTLLIPLATLQMTEAVYRWLLDAPGESEADKIKDALTNSFLIVVGGLSISFLALFISTYFIKFDHWFLFGILLCSGSLFQYFQQISRGLKNNRLYSASGILNTFLLVVFNVAFLLIAKQQIEGLLKATILANFISIAYIIYISRPFKHFDVKFFSGKSSVQLLNYSWPLIPNSISWWMITLANRYIVVAFLGAEQNGIFALSNRFPAIIIIFNSIFMLAFQDHVIASQNKQGNSYNAFSDAYMRIELSLVLLLISLSRLMVNHFIDPKFHDSWRYMPLLYIGVAYSAFAAFLGTGYIGSKQTRGIFMTTLIGGIINVSLSFALIGKIGLFAPAIGTLAGFAAIWLIRNYMLRNSFKIKIDPWIFGSLTLLIGGFIYLTSFENDLIDLLLIVASCGVGIFVNQKLFTTLINNISEFLAKRKVTLNVKNK